MELLENEKIKDIKGYEGLYGITSFGRVYSYITNKFLTPTENKSKYRNTRLYVNLGRGIENRYYIHQLVAQAFIPNIENKKEIDHIDNDPTNNKVENLKWVNHQENMKNKITLENLKNNSALSYEILDKKTGLKLYGYKNMAKACGVSYGTILKHCNNKVKNPRWIKTGNKKNLKKIEKTIDTN